jgi:general secretion pathway protein E
VRARVARRNRDTRYYPKNVREPDALETIVQGGDRPVFYHPRGCERCSNTGFMGRRGIYELLLMDDAVGPLVLRNADAQTIKRSAIEQGMDSLRDDGARKVLLGLTSVEEVLLATQEDAEIESERASVSMRSLS